MLDIVAVSALTILVWMLLLWGISIPRRDVSIVDLGWGLGFVMVAWAAFFRTSGDAAARWVLPILTTLWGVRLSIYLAWRNHGRPEDQRYAAMRARSPQNFWLRSLLVVFLLQGVVMFIVSLPLQAGIALNHGPLTPFQWAGVLLWLIGWLFESFGDWQLARFKNDPRNAGKVMDRGLWRWTRHPNYFGDCLVWWGLFLVAAGAGQGLGAVIGPVVMTFCLLKFSGVALLERSLKDEKPQYADYVRRTSAFFPWPPKKT